MHFDLVQTISLAGKTAIPNDDRIGSADRHAWVIDGATDLGEPGLVGERGGAAWLAAVAHQAFYRTTGDGGVTGICQSVFEDVAAAYMRDRQRDPVSSWELPRASLAAIAIEGAMLTCAFLGDCVVLHRGRQGVAFVTPAPDRHVESAQAAAVGTIIGADGRRSPEVIADRRVDREKPKRALSVDAAQSAAGVRVAQTPLAQGDDVFLFSDGFAALFDGYAAYTPEAFIDRVLAVGLTPLAQQLRQIEHDDAACVRYPRFKQSDDATALWLKVG